MGSFFSNQKIQSFYVYTKLQYFYPYWEACRGNFGITVRSYLDLEAGLDVVTPVLAAAGEAPPWDGNNQFYHHALSYIQEGTDTDGHNSASLLFGFLPPLEKILL